MMIFGILLGILALVAAYGLTMWGYFALRRKMPGAKFFVEIVIMGVAIAFSFCVKLTVYMLQEGDNIEDGAAALFFAVYKAACRFMRCSSSSASSPQRRAMRLTAISRSVCSVRR